MKASALTVLAAATCLVASAYELSSSPSNMVTVGNITFFAANDGKNDVQLWRTDSTESGTVMVRDTERRIGPIFPNFGIVAVGNRVAFVASASPLGIGVWSSDGTEEGTQMLTGNFSAMNFGPVAGGALYFVTVSTSGMAQL